MKIPFLKHIPKSESTITAFGGYNAKAKIAENEFSDMKNLSGDNYPVLSTRKKRSQTISTYSGKTIYGMINKDALCVVAGNTFGETASLYINHYAVAGLTLSATEKQLVSMGAYLVIFPDKKWINTKDLTDYGDIDATFVSATTVTYSLCRYDATAYAEPTVSATEPSNPSNGDLWIDTSATPHLLKQYSTSAAVWTEIVTTYIKIAATNIAEKFSAGDAVKISGSDIDINGDGVYIEAAQHNAGGTGDYIVVAGILDAVTTQSTALTVKRAMPSIDFVIESNNRLWACKYGLDAGGNAVNEIYASKLGDFKNWNCFQGLSTDSYAASLGTDGPFTGAITYKGYPMFFKEECYHKVYGDYPANFQITSTSCDGVQKGSGKSLAIVDAVLYYKGVSGVFAYDGSLPDKVSDKLSDGYSSAVSGGIGTKYYISMQKSGSYSLFVFDAAKGLWHREDETQAKCFCTVSDELYMATSGGIVGLNGTITAVTSATEWYFISGLLGLESPERKYVSNAILRMHLATGGTAKVYIEYDKSGTWVEAASIDASKYTQNVSIRLRRCDCFRLKVSGTGDIKLYSLTKVMKDGSTKV